MLDDLSQLQIDAVPAGAEFDVKVVPGASKTRVAGVLGDALKLAVSAPPQGGRANREVIDLLADALGVRRGDVSIRTGHGRPRKRVLVRGRTPDEVRAALGGPPRA